ncbi:MAG: protein kinase domain-containing protein [Planctomycetaceae bacterium]
MSAPDPPNVDATQDEPLGAPHHDETPAEPLHLSPTPPASDQRSPSAVSIQSIGRYRVERRLGQGGFGAVYLAMDDELNRRVAIKVPRRLAETQLAEYRDEAQKLAKLEHPGVVPIYDIGHTTEFPVFLVTKFIEGGTLSDWVQRARPDFLTVARLIAEVAEALHATHLKGIFHRDIKPANILVDATGKPYLADFGLALTEGHGLNAAPEILGTPAYMSPEQAAGEGHRVDGQTDIFSLGVVIYELLVGVRPFRASEKLSPRDRNSQLLEMVKTYDPRPPRQVNDQVPKELERICMKALAKRKPDRYTNARDMAEDLRHFVGNPATQEVASVRVHVPPTREASTPAATPTPGAALGAGHPTPPQMISDREPLKIVPKGLRSFDASDASFFLDLLPGPRDRDGLPESIRFWKTRIESLDQEVTFAAGVLYGPSGCGKSSLVKAGLIPRLAEHIVPIYVEASGDETEQRLARAIRRACPALNDDELSLTVLLKTLRRGIGLPGGKKVLIVLDQFEQWLHANRGQTNQELPAALRQCDGDRVQCLILVRDDFWLAISRFLQQLEVRLIEGENCAMADLFDQPHARKVLDAFGVAFNVVHAARVNVTPPPDIETPTHASRVRHNATPTQASRLLYDQFLDQSVTALSEENKIISVRLTLFAEMMKSKPWTPATLRAIGGVTGVGVTFLEETFSAKTAKIAYRTHEVAVRGVLKALLPELGTDIKGHQVPRDVLLQASGYAQRPGDFELLLHILDRDLRLITQVDAEGERGREGEGEGDNNLSVSPSPPPPLSLSYQLAHDYLVPSIRDWLTKKQKETWRGRAALRLEERSAQWQRTHERRHLPSLLEFTSIVCGVPNRKRTAEQRRMMRTATRHHAVRWGSLLLMLVATVFGVERHLAERQRIADDKTATTRINDLAESPAAGVNVYIDTLEPLRPLAIPKLRSMLADPQAKPLHRLHAAYALAAFGESALNADLITVILDNVPTADSAEAKNMAAALRQIARLGEPEGISPRTSGATNVNPQSPGANAQWLTKDSVVAAKIAQRIQTLDLSDEATRSDRLTIKIRYAALALYLGDPSLVSPMLQLGPDPAERTAFMLRLKDWPANTPELRDILATTTDDALRSGVVLAIGRFPKETIADFDALSSVLQELFFTAPDGGSHSALDWTLRQWNVAHAARVRLPDVEQAARLPGPDLSHASRVRHNEPRRWSINSVGMTLVEIPAGKHHLIDEEENPYEVEFTRPVYLSNREVTVAQFLAFANDPNTPGDQKPQKWEGYEQSISPTDDCPVQQISWFDAVMYCNWLSHKEGLTLCYTETRKKLRAVGDDEPDELVCNFAANGYRLPTEAEWEVACRAGTTTTFSCGKDDVELREFAVFGINSRNRTWASGTKLPNGWGLFDMHGNVWEWCGVWYEYELPSGVDPRGPSTGLIRCLRGGGWGLSGVGNFKEEKRQWLLPLYRYHDLGFRLAAVPAGR